MAGLPLRYEEETAAPTRRQAGPLGINANTTDISSCVQVPEPEEYELWSDYARRRQSQYRLQQGSQRLYKQVVDRGVELAKQRGQEVKPHYERIVSCCNVTYDAEGVKIMYSPEHGASSLGGVVTCGSVWMCPVCASKVSERRRQELSEAVKSARSRGLVVALATFTLSHHSGDKLYDLRRRLNTAYSCVKKRYGWKRLVREFGVDGPGRNDKQAARLYSVRGFETTWGYNGFHPHLHVIFFLAPGADVEQFGRQVRDLWYEELGGLFVADATTGELLPIHRERWERGVRVASNDGEVADYITKFGRDPRWDVAEELAKSVSKQGHATGHSRHYTMLDLLRSYVEKRNVRHGRLWVEYGLSMKGCALLTWSPGLRLYLGLLDDKTDEELATEVQEGAYLLVQIDQETWTEIVRTGKRAEIMHYGDEGQPERLLDYLRGIRAQILERRSRRPLGVRCGPGEGPGKPHECKGLEDYRSRLSAELDFLQDLIRVG